MRDISFGALAFSTGLPRQFLLPITVNNQGAALTYGVETSIDLKPLTNWRLQGSYSFLNIDFSSNNFLTKSNPSGGGAEKVAPQHQLSVRSNYDFSERLQLNFWLRHTSDIAFYNIPDYATMDAKLVYRPTKNTELFIVCQNLFSQNHRELVSDFIPLIPVYIQRGVYAGIQWRY